MLGVISNDCPMSRSSVIGVPAIVLELVAEVPTICVGLKPMVNGIVSPMKIRLTSLLAVKSSGELRMVTRLSSSSNCILARKLLLTTWNVKSP